MVDEIKVDGEDGALEAWTIGEVDPQEDAPAEGRSHGLWVQIGLVGLFVALLTPVVGLTGLWATVLLGHLAALGLDASHAHLPTLSLDADWDLRLVYVVALAVMGLRAAVSRLPKPRWRVAGLGPWHWWFLIGGVTWLATGAALVFEQHVLDIADGVHLVVLGATALWMASTTMWLMASCAHAAAVALAIAAKRSRVVGATVATVGIASMAVATPVLANPEIIESSDVYRDAPMLAGAFEQLDEIEHDLGATMLALPPAATDSVADDRYTTVECMEELAETPQQRGLSAIEEVIVNVTRKVGDRDEARDIVHTKVLAICRNLPYREGPPLVRLLQRAATRGVIDYDRHRYRMSGDPVCLIDRADDSLSSEEQFHQLQTFRDVWGELSARDRDLLDQHVFQGKSYAEMAAFSEPDAKADSVGRATRRAWERLEEIAQRHCH